VERDILVWDNDIGWCEMLRKELAKEFMRIKECDSYDSICHKDALLLVLSVSQLQEAAEEKRMEQKEDTWLFLLREICRTIEMPVVLITEKETQEQELAALLSGVWDYVERDKDIRICVKRIFLCLAKEAGNSLSYNSSVPVLDEKNHRLLIGAKSLFLTEKEYRIFEVLLKNEGEIVSRQELLESVWRTELPNCQRVVDTLIKQLRVKLKETQYVIHSKYRLGYYLSKT
jgi:DNA-binding response OmpR family regulator